jgi:hypothetical protein
VDDGSRGSARARREGPEGGVAAADRRHDERRRGLRAPARDPLAGENGEPGAREERGLAHRGGDLEAGGEIAKALAGQGIGEEGDRARGERREEPESDVALIAGGDQDSRGRSELGVELGGTAGDRGGEPTVRERDGAGVDRRPVLRSRCERAQHGVGEDVMLDRAREPRGRRRVVAGHGSWS